MARAIPCACRSPNCTAWHVSPHAAVQSVRFTEAEARVVAYVLNELERAGKPVDDQHAREVAGRQTELAALLAPFLAPGVAVIGPMLPDGQVTLVRADARNPRAVLAISFIPGGDDAAHLSVERKDSIE